MEKLSQSGIELKNQRGENISDCHENFKRSVQSDFLDKLIININTRFALMSCSHSCQCLTQETCQTIRNPKLNLTAAASTENSGNDTTMSLQDYGNATIKTMCLRFAVDVEPALEEWEDFKQYFSDHMKKLKLRDVTHQLCTDETQRELYPNMSKLAQICCVLPTHTADCERDFSQLKFIKTVLRNRMKEQTLDAIIRIVIEGPTVHEFPFKEAVQLWAQRKKSQTENHVTE